MTTNDKEASQKDYTYLNLQLINTGTTDIPATYNETRTRPIVDDMEAYMLSIIRMKVPSLLYLYLYLKMLTYLIGFTLGAGNNNLLGPNTVQYSSRPVNADPNNRNIYYYNQFLDDVNEELILLWNLY